ncbi:MAG: hypothetical protein ACKVXR_10860 [Planctomycetota bacterium]
MPLSDSVRAAGADWERLGALLRDPDQPACRRTGPIDNGTSLGEARRSPAESARRWRPARALGRPVPLEEESWREKLALALHEQLGRAAADQPACRRIGPIDNGTSLGEA